MEDTTAPTQTSSRYKKYNDAHKEARKARRSKSADACIRRTHLLWKAGAFDVDAVRPLLPTNRRLVGFRTPSGTPVLVYDGSTGDFVKAEVVRMSNLRSRGYFLISKTSGGSLLASPIWACFREDRA